MTYEEMSNQQLRQLWANDEKRRRFVERYKRYASICYDLQQLGLTFYGIRLPNGTIVWAMEHWLLVCEYDPKDGVHGFKYKKSTKYYYQEGEHFEPTAVSVSYISNILKCLKMELQKGEIEA